MDVLKIVVTVLEVIASVALIAVVLMQSGRKLVCPVRFPATATPI